MEKHQPYGCAQYREEMTLLELRRRLNMPGLAEEDRRRIRREIKELERKMEME